MNDKQYLTIEEKARFFADCFVVWLMSEKRDQLKEFHIESFFALKMLFDYAQKEIDELKKYIRDYELERKKEYGDFLSGCSHKRWWTSD